MDFSIQNQCMMNDENSIDAYDEKLLHFRKRLGICLALSFSDFRPRFHRVYLYHKLC